MTPSHDHTRGMLDRLIKHFGRPDLNLPVTFTLFCNKGKARMMTQAVDFDVVVIGGGPGGAAVSCYLARAGLKVKVMEREAFPRPHVGESLVPSSTRVFRELEFLPKMEQAGFPHKYGAAWTTADQAAVYQMDWKGLSPDNYAAVRFAEREQEGVAQNYTFHVDRAKFDQLLLEHASEAGAEVEFEATVTDVDFSDPEIVRITSTGREGGQVTTARMVADASGRRTFLGNSLDLRVRDRYFDQYALHTWFGHYDRSVMASGPDQDNYIFIHFLPISNTWVWQIPITDEITSVGVVTQKANFLKSKAERQQFFWDALESRPALAAALREAEQLRPLKDEGDYSYAMKQICGDRFVLVGDAARFVDPIFSTGVSIALNSARFAARDIIAAAEANDFSRERFKTFEETMTRGVRNWYRFIALYYRLNVLFTAFVIDERYRLDVLKLLQGDVYDEEEPAVLHRMREIVSEVESNPRHLWHPFLGDLRADDLALTL
jgi:1H-pyrrole-2-carbonyl-[peptidyl-carrier protein] chlorinase